MSYEPVDVYVLSSAPDNAPIAGAVVHVYSTDGALFYTRGETDESGKASFLLSTQSYSLRFFKQHTQFTQPQLMEVVGPPAPAVPSSNVFNVYCEVLSVPVASDPRLCRASGFFRDVSGSPKRNLDIHFIARFDPILLDGDGVVTERQTIRTDDNGFAQIDLIRFGNYCAMIQDREDLLRAVSVPNQASVNLPDLLFPRVKTVTLDPSGPYSLYVEDSIEVTPTVVTTDGRELDGAAIADVLWSSSDTGVATVAVSGDNLVITAVGAGEASVVAERRDTSVISIPDTPVEVVDGAISVH